MTASKTTRRSFFEQDYPAFEILFGVRSQEDPAIAVVERLRSGYPFLRARRRARIRI